MPQSRRKFLQTTSAVAAATLLGGPYALAVEEAARPQITLQRAGKQNGILVGSAVSSIGLERSPAYADLVRTQCAIIVAENEMKFGSLRPTPDSYNFRNADVIADFAQKNGILLRGHNFVWHRQLPAWFAGYATPANAQALLIDHIEHVGGHFAGRIHSWDVCNEVIAPEDHLPGGLRNSPWYKLLGPSYIDTAFRTARRVDPHALLCYNDYGIEGESPADATKREAVLGLVRGMQARGVPIDAVGIQAHISAGPGHEYGPGLTHFMAEIQAMGLKLLLTEMDVNDRALPALPATRDRDVALVYGSFLHTALANTDTIALLTWGLTDKYTWLNGEDSRPDHLPERCLPFDDEFKPVLAYIAEVEALVQAPKRTLVLGRTTAANS